MKTPREKAVELVERMFNITPESHEWTMQKSMCKKCALICVDEIVTINVGIGSISKQLEHVKYWQQVKQHIEKM